MPKIPKPRRRKRERKMTGFQTPPSSMPGEISSAQEFQDVRSSSPTKSNDLRQPKTQVPLLTKAAASPLLLPLAFSQETTGVAASPSTAPLPASPSSASSGVDGPSPLPPPSTVSSSRPGWSPTVLASEPAASQPGTCAVPNSTTAPLHSQTRVPSPPEVQPGKQRDAERPLLQGPSDRAAAKRRMSLRELVALRSMRLRSLSGQWVNRGQMLLTPLLSHLRSSSASGSPPRSQQPAQQQTNGQFAAGSAASDERARLPEPHPQPSKLRWRDERLDHPDSAPCVGQNIPSSSRTVGSLPADPVQRSRHFPALNAAGRSQCEEPSQQVEKHGVFQTTVFYFVLLVAFVLPFHTLPLRIVNQDVDHWCARPARLHNVSPEMWKEVMIPRSEDGHYSRCRMNAEWNTTVIVTAFDVGAIFTLIVSGLVADRLGRKPVIQFCTIVLQASGVVILFSTIMNSFIAMRLLQGAASSTLFNTSFVLLVEVLSPEHRTLYSIGAMMGKVLGAFIASVMMWAKFSWYTLQLTSMLPCLFMLKIITVILESPRWLLARGNVEEAEAVILQAATLNGQSLFEVRQQWARTRRDFRAGRLDAAAQDAHCEAQRVRCRRYNSVILYYLWMVTTVASEAASLKIHYLDWYPAALLALSSLLAFPTELVAIVSTARLGRRAFAVLVAGPCRSRLLRGRHPRRRQLGTLYTAEMYPTVVRCTGLALCKTFSAVVSVATPLAVYLGLLPVFSVPLGVVSIMCVTAAYLAMRLPDTIEGNRAAGPVRGSTVGHVSALRALDLADGFFDAPS
ncbi:hypothetical protein MTO96_001820 [Rhipicephalus appendiculatus]